MSKYAYAVKCVTCRSLFVTYDIKVLLPFSCFGSFWLNVCQICFLLPPPFSVPYVVHLLVITIIRSIIPYVLQMGSWDTYRKVYNIKSVAFVTHQRNNSCIPHSTLCLPMTYVSSHSGPLNVSSYLRHT